MKVGAITLATKDIFNLEELNNRSPIYMNKFVRSLTNGNRQYLASILREFRELVNQNMDGSATYSTYALVILHRYEVATILLSNSSGISQDN